MKTLPTLLLPFVALACGLCVSSCTTSDLVSQLKEDQPAAPQVIPLGKGKKVVMNYALRRTRLQVQMKFDVVKVTTMQHVPGGTDKATGDPPRFELWPNPASDAITCAIDYVNDPQLRFELLADDRRKAFLGSDESFSYDDSGRLTSLALNYEGKAAAAVKDLMSAAFNLTSMGISLAKFNSAGDTYERKEVLTDKIIVKKTIYPEALASSGGSRMCFYSFAPDIDAAKRLYISQNSQGATSINSNFRDISLNISPTRGRIASSRSLRTRIEAASNGGRLTGLPVRPDAPPATLSYVVVGDKTETLGEQEIFMPELADVRFLPFPSNPWRSSIKTSVDLQASGAIKKYGRATSSAGADAAAAANSIATDLNTDVTKINTQIATAKKTDASLQIKIMTEKATILQKEADLDAKIAAAEKLPPGSPEKQKADADIETAKAQLAVERQKLNYLNQGIDVS
jgi:hypothetical protein